MPPGSCSSAQVTVPPVGTCLLGRLRRFAAAPAGPANAPAITAPAPTRPALESRSRRLISLCESEPSVGLSDMFELLLRPGNVLENLSDARRVAFYVVVER